jgi:hypothetical protein
MNEVNPSCNGKQREEEGQLMDREKQRLAI